MFFQCYENFHVVIFQLRNTIFILEIEILLFIYITSHLVAYDEPVA